MKCTFVKMPGGVAIACGGRGLGTIVLHSSSVITRDEVVLAHTEPFRSALAEAGASMSRAPRGAAVGLVDVVACRAVEDVVGLTDRDRAFGDFSAGRWAWFLARPRALRAPVFIRGFQKLWPLKGEDARLVRQGAP
jgi:activating signal cointegrator 1